MMLCQIGLQSSFQIGSGFKQLTMAYTKAQISPRKINKIERDISQN